MFGGIKMTQILTEFFLPMVPPQTTHQQKKVRVIKNKNGKHVPNFYEPEDLQVARSKLMAHLGKHIPDKPYNSAVRLLVKWCFPVVGKHKNGEYKQTKADLDNLQKLLNDCMTDLNYWVDDALVASLIAEKFYADMPGIYIKIEVL